MKEKLKKLKGFKGKVASIILKEGGEDIIGYMKDVVNKGCVSGIVGELVYYRDTNRFYDENEEVIEDMLDDFRDNMGFKSRCEAIDNLNGYAESIEQEKNLLSWFAFEETTREILQNNLEIEI